MGEATLKIFGAGVIAIFVILIIKRSNPESAIPIRMVVGIIMAAGCVMAALPILGFIREFEDLIGVSDGKSIYFETLIKALGIAILTHVCATACRDSGEGGIAGYVELGGRIEIVILSLPLIRDVLSASLELMEMK